MLSAPTIVNTSASANIAPTKSLIVIVFEPTSTILALEVPLLTSEPTRTSAASVVVTVITWTF